MSHSSTLIACAGCLLLLIVFARAEATTPSDYERRVSNAASVIEQLEGVYEDESRSEPLTLHASLDRLRTLLPAKETVEVNGERIAVNNAWLHQMLSDSEKATTQTERAEILTRTAERLRALDAELREAGEKKAASSDKEANKGRLAEILRRPEYVRTAAETSALDRLIEAILNWLSRLIPRPRPMRPGGSPLISFVAQIVVVGIAVAAIALLIWRYGPRLLGGRRKKKTEREARIVLGERLEPDQTSLDLLNQAEALARRGDLRAAIRKAYIALLCELGDRKLISLAQHKTNRDYLNSVRDIGSLHRALRKLTDSFELHWYGFVPAGEADWIEFRDGFNQVVKSG